MHIHPWPLLALILLAGPAGAATVLSVGDGDTIRVADGPQQLAIRLACIDAPETAQAPYGAASREYLQGLAPVGSVVTLKAQTTDRYGRTVAEVFRNGRSVNLMMVQSGQAFAYRKYLAACDGGAYLAAEAQAKQSRRGVWAVTGGIERPWDWRRGSPQVSGAAPRYSCEKIGSYATAQQLLQQGHTYLDGDGDGIACGSLKRRP